MVGIVQFQFFLNLVFETIGEGVHIYLTKIFPKLVSFDLFDLKNASFPKLRWGKITLNLKDP